MKDLKIDGVFGDGSMTSQVKPGLTIMQTLAAAGFNNLEEFVAAVVTFMQANATPGAK